VFFFSLTEALDFGYDKGMKRSELVFTSILVPVDFLMLALAGLATYFLRTSLLDQYWPVLFYTELPFREYFLLTVFISFFLLVVFALVGLYKIKAVRSLWQDFVKIVIGVSAGIISVVFYIFVRREWFNSRFLILGGWLAAIIFVLFGRFLVSCLQKFFIRKYHFGVNRVLVVGRDEASRKIIEKIRQTPELGYYLAGNLVEPDLAEIKSRFGNPGLEEIILADPDWPKEKVLDLVNFCEENHLVFKFVPNLFQTLTSNTLVDALGGMPLVELKRTSLDGWGRIIKRMIDIVGSLFGLIVLSPFLAAIAFLIKWGSEGPVLVRLKRISQNKEIGLYKFRSMVKDAENLKKFLWQYNERKDGPLFKMKDDPRVTKFGRVLRKYRLDEFPQLLNVLKGEISLVGPRPHQPDEIEKYQRRHKKVLDIKAGVTGMAQISGSSDLSFEEEVKLDACYIENWSLLKDFKILFRTFLILFKDRSAC
jgi:exopolysaccharide biosynthesis polyprenyl glycosylphosphotransferase